MNPHSAVAHLTPERWERVNRALVRKALAEFSHERILAPEPRGNAHYEVRSDDGATEYRFTARRMRLDHWHIDAQSIVRLCADVELPLDAAEFILELRGTLGLDDDNLPVYLEEITSTLASLAFKSARASRAAASLATAAFQEIEAAMTEGHPCFVANSGRLGFDLGEYHAYAPEAGRPVTLVWVAALKDRSTFTGEEPYDDFIKTELPARVLGRFADVLTGLGRDPADYHLIPVHPWQWWNRLSVTFAGEVARRHLVYLGESGDSYQAQQSIRTFFNLTAPHRHYVKTALSVLNMGFIRGLSAEYMRGTPAINAWLAGLIERDEVLRGTGLAILRERAAIGYHHHLLEAATEKGSPYRKMLAALWRQSPIPLLKPGERLTTMAALLHVDHEDRSLVGALIAGSGLTSREWLDRYLRSYLTPLLHCFYAYGLVFMPHGENVILVLDENGAPVRAIFKDLAEEIGVMDPAVPLPEGVERIRIEVPDDLWTLSIFTDVFDCFFRFLAAIMVAEGQIDEDGFWSAVADCVNDYQRAAPEFAARFRKYDLFADRFRLSCLNRLQLRNNRQMVDLTSSTEALQFAGVIGNPIAGRPPGAEP